MVTHNNFCIQQIFYLFVCYKYTSYSAYCIKVWYLVKQSFSICMHRYTLQYEHLFLGLLFWVSSICWMCPYIQYSHVCLQPIQASDQGVYFTCHCLMFGWVTSAWKRRSLSVEWPLPAGILKSQIFVFLWPDEDEDMPASGEHKHSEGSILEGTKNISSTTF